MMMMCQLEGCTCFHHRLLNCIEQGMNDEVQLLFKKVENFRDLIDCLGETLIHRSVKHGNEAMVQCLIEKGCDVNAQDSSGVTPLMLSVQSGNFAITKILIENEADVVVTDFKGKSALELSFYDNLYRSPRPNRQLIFQMFFEKIDERFLTDKGILMKLLLDASSTVKLVIVVFGNAELTMFILENGYEIDYKEPVRSFTALYCALYLGSIEKVKLLIHYGANVNVINNMEMSILRQYTHKCECVDENSEILKIILQNSTRLYTPDIYGFTDIECLLSRGNKNTIRTIIQSGIEMVKSLNGSTLLHLLIENKNIEVNDIIELDIKFNVHAYNRDKRTALCKAAWHGFLEKLEFLLKHGAGTTSDKYDLSLALASAVMYSDCSSENKAKIAENLLLCGASPQATFEPNEVDNHHTLLDRLILYRRREILSIKTIVAHLAMMDTIDKAYVTEYTRSRIDAYPISKTHFNLCKRQLEQFKSTNVFGTVTLFKLLGESEERLLAYARNKELISAFQSTIEGMPDLEPYYLNVLTDRVAKALDKAKVEERVLSVINVLTNLCTNRYYVIARKIINYLESEDWTTLCQIKTTK